MEEHFKIKEGPNLSENRKLHVVEMTKPILSVSYMCENGTEAHLARTPFLKSGNERKPLIKKNGVYFVKAQIIHQVWGTIESCVRAEDAQKSFVRADGLQNADRHWSAYHLEHRYRPTHPRFRNHLS